MILMAYGGFRFSMDTFSFEKLARSMEARLEAQNVIGARPSLHKMGFGLEKVSFSSTFFPFHLPNNQGLTQVSAMRRAVGESFPLVAVRAQAADYTGMWALHSISETKSEIHPNGEGQKIEVELELYFDGQGSGGGGMLGAGMNLGSVINQAISLFG